MSSPPPEIVPEHIASAVNDAAEMTYEQAGAADEGAYLIGKLVGAHFVVASNAARDLISINEHLEKRWEEGQKLVKLCNGFKDGTIPVLSAVHELILQALIVVRQDSDYLNAQTEIYAKDLMESSAKLADMQEKSE